MAMLLAAAGCRDHAADVNLYREMLSARGLERVEPLKPGETLSLRRAALLANQDNETLAIHGEDYVQALSDKDRAVAGFLPTISLGPSYTVADYPGSGGGSGSVGTIGGFKIIGDTQRRFELPITANQNLFRGFRDAASFEAAVANVELRRQLMLDAQEELLLDVVRAYYQVLRLERSVEVIQKTLEAQLERVRDARKKLEIGSGKTLDIAQTEAQAATTRVQLVQARGDVRNVRTLLAYLIGSTGEMTGALSDEYQVPAEVGDVKASIEQAYANREDLRAAKSAVVAARHGVTAAIGEYYPSVALNLNYFLFREDYDNASKWNALLQINLPIFSAGIIEADVRLAWSRLRQATLQESLLHRQIEQQVRTRLQDLETSRLRLAELNAQITAATEALRQARAGRDAGTAIMLDVLSAQDVLLRAELDLASEQYNEKIQYLGLLRVTGRLTQQWVKK